MHIPAEKCTFPAEKCTFPAEKWIFLQGHIAGNRRKLQEGFRAQESWALVYFHKNMSVRTFKLPVSTVVGVFVGTPWCVLHRSPQLSWGFPWHLYVIGHPQTRHETPIRHETTYFAQSTPWPRPQRNLWCFAVFKAMNFNVPSIPDINPTRNNMNKYHKIRSKPNIKPQTQRETTASRSFIRLGPQIPPTVNRHETHPTWNNVILNLGRFSAATAVEIASQGCPCQVQQQCCFMWGLVS